FAQGDEIALGDLGTKLDLHDCQRLDLIDQWLGISVQLATSRPSRFWTFPIATVSQSESGIESVHQSVAVLPHWLIRGDADGRWSVTMQLNMDTTLAESRRSESAEAVVSSV
ncbi:MAG: DUF1926 domain-containing protein, partial [Planctomycetes bacterium]|nr:DUF1926 domain-containing protein [Planctomycetota bacterium]